MAQNQLPGNALATSAKCKTSAIISTITKTRKASTATFLAVDGEAAAAGGLVCGSRIICVCIVGSACFIAVSGDGVSSDLWPSDAEDLCASAGMLICSAAHPNKGSLFLE